MRILIAEDDFTTRAILTTALTKAGYEPLETTNGAEAWAELQKPNPPKLVVLDWLMPEMDGLEVAQRVRRELRGDDRPYILMLTSRTAKENVIMGLEGGVDDYLVKPFSVKELLARLAVGQRMVELFHDLHQERGWLQAVIESSRDGLIVVDKEQRLMVFNQPAAHLLRLPGQAADWLGRGLPQLIAALPDDSSEIGRFIAQAGKQLTDGQSPAVVVGLMSGSYTVRCEKLPVMAGETWLGQLLVLRDISEERAVAQMRADLIRTMVHDLRNPLTVISGVLELILEDAVSNKGEYDIALLENADQSSQRMLSLVSTILDINRLESDRMPLALHPFSLYQVVAAQCALQMSLARAKGITLLNNLPKTLPLAWGDQEVIGRVLQNLIGNALKFTPENGRIQINATSIVQNDQPILQIAIQDTGPGIPPEIEERLFEQFATGSHQAAGSGLGLAYCRMALEAHGQQIQAENDPTGGAIFTFTLAVAPDDKSEQETA